MVMVPDTRHAAVTRPITHITSMTIREPLAPWTAIELISLNPKPLCAAAAEKAAKPISKAISIEYPVKIAAIIEIRKTINANKSAIFYLKKILKLLVEFILHLNIHSFKAVFIKTRRRKNRLSDCTSKSTLKLCKIPKKI